MRSVIYREDLYDRIRALSKVQKDITPQDVADALRSLPSADIDKGIYPDNVFDFIAYCFYDSPPCCEIPFPYTGRLEDAYKRLVSNWCTGNCGKKNPRDCWYKLYEYWLNAEED